MMNPSSDEPRQPEHFLPWSQIEPLVLEGMTARELAVAVLTRLGLPLDKYSLLVDPLGTGVPIMEALRQGVTIYTHEELRRRASLDNIEQEILR